MFLFFSFPWPLATPMNNHSHVVELEKKKEGKKEEDAKCDDIDFKSFMPTLP